MRTGIRTLLTVVVAACCLVGTQGAGATDPAPSIGFSAGASTTVTAPGAKGLVVSLPITVSNGTGSDSATWSSDGAVPQSGSVDDQTTQIQVNVTGTDAQTITVTLSGDVVDPANATATITVNAAPTASIADPAAPFDGEPTATNVTLPVTLSAAPSTDVTVHYDSTQGTAKSGIDYALPGDGTVTIPAGSTTADIPITIEAATSGGSFTINLTGVDGGAVLGSSGLQANITINPAPLPVLSVADATIAASASVDVTLNFPITLSQAAATPVTLSYSTHFGTALLGQDFNVVPPFTATIPAGATTGTIPIRIMAGSTGGDFTLTISSPSANAAIDPAHATATIHITPAPLPQPTISIANTTVAAGATDATATIPVNLSAAAPTDITVDYQATSGTAMNNVDYTLPAGTLHILAGQKNASIPFTVKGGSLGGKFTVTLSNPTNAVLVTAGATATVTISAGSGTTTATPVVSIADVTVAAGAADTTGALTVTLSAKATADVTAAYAATDGTAKNGTDYALAPGTVTIPAGQLSATIPFTVKAGTSGGTFTVTLSGPSSNATLDPTASNATVTVVHGAALSISDTSATEKSGSATVTVTLVGAPTTPVTVAYTTADGTATQPADYTKTSGTLTFAVGDTTKTIAIPIASDSLIEGSETFVVKLSSPTNAVLAQSQATVTILDSSATVSSGSGSIDFGGQNLNGLNVPVAHGTGTPSGIQNGSSGGSSRSGGGPSTSGGGNTTQNGSGQGTQQNPTGGTGKGSQSSTARIALGLVSPWLTSTHQLRVRLGCPKSAKARCSGTIKALATSRGRSVTIGSSKLRIVQGRTALIRVKIGAAGMALLQRTKTLKVTLVVTLARSAGLALRSTGIVTLRAGGRPRTSVTITP